MKLAILPAALAYGLTHRGCSPADPAAHAMLWPRGGHVPQQTKAGQAIKPGQGGLKPRATLQPLPGASPPARAAIKPRSRRPLAKRSRRSSRRVLWAAAW